MRAGSKLMYGTATFLLIMTVIYAFATYNVKDDAYMLGLEWVGVVSMALAFLLAMMLGGYLHFTEKRIDILPEDWEEAEIEDGAGVLGFFSPSSIWPAAMSLSILVLGLGVIFLYYWMIALGGALLIWSTTKLNLQYGEPKEKH